MKKFFLRMIRDEKGINTVEIVVLVAIAIGLALLFREQLLGFINQIFKDTLNPTVITSPTPTP